MNEKRKLQRRHLLFFLRVFNQNTDDLLGYLADITTQGIKIMSEDPIQVGHLYQLKVLVDGLDAKRNFLCFDAYSRWSQHNLKTEFYDTGFELKNMTPIIFQDLKKLIDDLGLVEQAT